MTWQTRTLAAILEIVQDLEAKVDKIMSEQSELDTDVANLVAALNSIAAEIAALKNANPAVDFTALEAAIGTAQQLAAPPAS